MWATAAVVTPTMTELLRTKGHLAGCELKPLHIYLISRVALQLTIRMGLKRFFVNFLTRLRERSQTKEEVVGASGVIYTCFESSTYCSCPAYRFSVLHKEDQLMCKHHLAMRLSNITRKTKVTNLTDQQMAQLLSSLG
ncbi:uncharacterized protein LOC112561024 isoform X4 [Pomacea canaliculata]|uniref:uncharacterized protein LOC112561024 isoform X4 n=1 Tax=Pomacea canaliculata TaxID=400727 RepID=UPI000D728AB1|nr:uncharacterized protein LOC112561024 isoform X4 [Pomacea canaliculata]